MEVYLDNAATTRCCKEAGEVIQKTLCEDYGNPSSRHQKGIAGEGYIKRASRQLADILRVEPGELIYNSGATEGDNQAIIGTALANQRRGRHLITTAIEHPAVLEPMRYLEELGFLVTYLPPSKDGRVDPEEVLRAVTDQTILISMMYVNNETGVIQPVEETAGLVKEKHKDILFHTDFVQGFGKLPFYPKQSRVDLLTISGHKIHGPKGIGCLYADSKVKMKPLILGGGQQRGRRQGTENVPGIAGLGEAAAVMYQERTKTMAHLAELKAAFLSGLREIDGIEINGSREHSVPWIINFSVRGVRSEVLLNGLSERGICVSAGSACAANKQGQSLPLKAMGLSRERLDSALRISFSKANTGAELQYTLTALKELAAMLRKYQRR